VRATQFFEFMEPTMSSTSDASVVRLPATPIQPIASADVVDAVVDVATHPLLNGIRNVAGPDVFHLDDLGRATWPRTTTAGPLSLTIRPACSLQLSTTYLLQDRRPALRLRTTRNGSRWHD
jgi:uncharacterized protein YbjT (DUF2867 family)